jgi:hypothetical protein
MTDAIKLSDLKYPDLQSDGSRRSETRRHRGGPCQTRALRTQASASSPRETESPVVPDSLSGIAAPCLQPGELDRLYRSLAEVTPESHPLARHGAGMRVYDLFAVSLFLWFAGIVLVRAFI